MRRVWISRVVAAVFILAGAAGLFTVFWLFPWLGRERDPEWMAQHSEQAHWEHIQNRIRIVGWQHDDFSTVGRYGNEEWAAWIIERLTMDADPRDCYSGHKHNALESITNFAPDLEHNPWREVLPLWQAWWKENKGKTQNEWIVAGFAAVGVTIHNPPVPEDWPALLTVLARADRKREETKTDPRREPTQLYYNAYRCLRDSGFNSVNYAMESPLTPEIKAGLEAYDRRRSATGYWRARAGALFKERGDDRFVDFMPMPRFREPAYRWGWGSASSAVVFAGVWVWLRSRRKAKP